MVKIAIFGNEKDPQVALVKEKIKNEGVETKVFDLRSAKIVIVEKRFDCNGENLLDYNSFYVRQIATTFPEVFRENVSFKEWLNYYPEYVKYIVNERERMALRLTLVKLLSEEKFVVNPYESQFYQRLKVYQSYLLEKYTLPIPNWLCTNIPAVVKDFCGNYVYKALTSGTQVNVISKKWLAEWKNNPRIFQKYVDGLPVRVALVGEEIIGGCKIISKAKSVDVRLGELRCEKLELPESIKEMLIRGGKLLKLRFSCIDLIEKDNEYFVLEYNPSPGFLLLEEAAKIPVAESLAYYLIKNAKK